MTWDMYYPVEYLVLIVAVLLILSVVACKIASKFALPAILIFIVIGMIAGSEGLGGIYEDPHIAPVVGTFALVIIIFTGGLQTEWTNLRPVLWEGISLSVLGVLLTTVILGWFTSVMFGLPLIKGLILGAIVSATDAPAVFSILRAKGIKLKGKVRSLLELESGSNDPMAVFLTMGLIYITKNTSTTFAPLVLLFFRQAVLGLAIGFATGRVIVFVIRRIRLQHEGLYPVLTLSFALLAYGVTTSLDGSGFLAVYIAGLVVANGRFEGKKNIVDFHDGFSWLMQIAMFLVLGLLVLPSHLAALAGDALIIAAMLMFVARPVSVFASLALSKMTFKEKTMVSWVGLRGAVPIVLATFFLVSGSQVADELFHVVFFIVLVSILVQGPSIAMVARKLGLEAG